MNRRAPLSVGVAFTVLAALLVALAVAPSAPAAAAAPPLAVKVAGNTLVDPLGRPVRVLGVNRAGTEFACAQGWGHFDGPTDAAALSKIGAWGANAVRVPLNESCWLGIGGVSTTWGGASYRTAIQSYVQRLHEAGMLVILDLHWAAPGSALATKQIQMADADHAPAFWQSVATTFRADPAVIFDLYNEPYDISWSCWRDGCTTSAGYRAAGMQSLVDAVRSTGALQPLLLNGIQYGGDLSQWLTYAPKDPAGQLIAGAHIYDFSGCNTVSCWDATLAPVAAQVPMITGEVGQSNCGRDWLDRYLDWADSHGVSYTPWTWNTWDCNGGPSLITNYDGTPTGFGIGVRERLLKLAAQSAAAPTASPRPPAPTVAPTLPAPTVAPTRPAPTASPTVTPKVAAKKPIRRPLRVATVTRA